MRKLGTPNRMPTNAAIEAAEQDAPEHRQWRDIDSEYLKRNADAGAELVGAVGADRHEGAAPERKLAAITGQNIESHGGERQDQERNEDSANKIFTAERPDLEGVEHRDADKGKQQQSGERDTILADRKDRHVGCVARLELAGLAIEHV